MLLADVDWLFVLQAAALAALVSLLRLILATLPADPTPALAIVETAPTLVQHFHAADPAPADPAADLGGGARAPGGDLSQS